MDDFVKFYNLAANFLSFRGRSEKEVRDKLNKANAPDEILEKVIDKLKQQKFINDLQFAEDWVRSRTTYRLKSKRIIKTELLKKGVAEEIINRVLEGENSEEKKLDDFEQAKKLVEGRIERYKGLAKFEVYRKLGGFLGRRGFDWETARRAIDECL